MKTDVRTNSKASIERMDVFHTCEGNGKEAGEDAISLVRRNTDMAEQYYGTKQNGRKSLAPLFVFAILRDSSSKERPMTQKEIIERLDAWPYAISIERKAVSRALAALADSDCGIITTQKGAYYDPDEDWAQFGTLARKRCA